MTDSHTPDKKRRSRRTWLVVGYLVVVAAVIGFLSGGESDDVPEAADTTTTTTPAPTEAATTTKAPTTTEPPTTTEAPETTVATTTTTTTTTPRTLEDTLRAAIREALGEPNREGVDPAAVRMGDGQIYVTWAIGDSLTEEMIRDNARIEATEILEAVASSGVDYERLSIEGTFSMVDQLGNTEEDRVVAATYPKSLVDQIDFEGFLFENVFEIAEPATVFIHPAFEAEG